MIHPSSNIKRVLIVCAALLLVQCSSDHDEASNDQLNAFFGTFTGKSSNVAQGELSERDLSVTIKPKEDDAFTIEWTSTTYPTDGTEKKVETSIDFLRSPRPGIFTSAMKKDVFDNMVSEDPTTAEAAAYVWAGVRDDTLTVRALYILDAGDYEMHSYSRTLQDGGLALEFERTRNLDVITHVTAFLERSE